MKKLKPVSLASVVAVGAVCSAAVPGVFAGEVPYGQFPLGENGDALVGHVIRHRGEPLRGVVTERTLRASGFGAVPDDGKDDQPALRALFAEAIRLGKTKVVIEPGVYDLLSAENDTYAFDLAGGERIGVRVPAESVSEYQR